MGKKNTQKEKKLVLKVGDRRKCGPLHFKAAKILCKTQGEVAKAQLCSQYHHQYFEL